MKFDFTTPGVINIDTIVGAAGGSSQPNFPNSFSIAGTPFTGGGGGISSIINDPSGTGSGVFESTTSGVAKFRTIKGGTNVTVAPGGTGNSDIIISSSGAAQSWVNVTGSSQAMTAGVAYVAANDSSVVTFTLPSSASFGDQFEIVGLGAGLWSIDIPSGQTLHFITGQSATISAAAQNRYDSVSFVCVVAGASAEYVARHAQGAAFGIAKG